MKKIGFNEEYGIQREVLRGWKTMTRSIVPSGTLAKAKAKSQTHGKREEKYIRYYSHFQLGDKVAIAQSYEDLANSGCEQLHKMLDEHHDIKREYTGAGWSNKMCVMAELMPHHIFITKVKVEHLQDISDEDCIKEGIGCRDDLITHNLEDVVAYTYRRKGKEKLFLTPRDAFASLIDAIKGKGTWESNPLVYVYEFELID